MFGGKRTTSNGPSKLLLAGLLLAGLILSILLGWFVYSQSKTALTQRVDSLAIALPASELNDLDGTALDLQDASYISLKQRLVEVRKANSDIRFIYVSDIKSGTVRFLVDSEDPSSDGYSAPGSEFDEASSAYKRVFDTSKTIVEGPVKDKWGLWFSGLAATKDTSSKLVIGIDISAYRIIFNTFAYAVVPLLLSIGLVLLLVVQSRSRRRERALSGLKDWVLMVTSHDLLSPLIGIRWASQSMESGIGNKSLKDFSASLDGVIESLEYLLEIASGRKSVAAGNPEPISVNEVISNVVAKHKLLAAKNEVGINIDSSLSAEVRWVVADRFRLQRVFNNLISNAIKYSPQNTSVVIAYQEQTHKHMISVADHGLGIPKNEQELVFTRDFRSSNAIGTTQGHGLGLSSIKQIILELHGEIWFDSVDGEGSTFYVSLPKL